MTYEIPNNYKDVVDVVSNWFQTAASIPNSEIEARIGKFDQSKQRFSSKVGSEWFNKKLQQCMQTGTKWDKVESETTTTYLFADGTRGVKQANNNIIFQKKTRYSNIDLNFEGAKWQVRLSHSTETTVPPACAEVVWVRMRRRQSFFYKMWRYDFSLIFEGNTFAAAKKSDVKHEIEIEWNGQGMNFTYLTLSLLMKAQDMMCEDVHAHENAKQVQVLRTKTITPIDLESAFL